MHYVLEEYMQPFRCILITVWLKKVLSPLLFHFLPPVFRESAVNNDFVYAAAIYIRSTLIFSYLILRSFIL